MENNTMKRITSRHSRRGAIAVLTAIMMVALAGMVAFAVDYGFLVKVRADMQRAADAAALAALQDLIPEIDGTQDTALARNTVRSYVQENLGDTSFQVPDGDIEIGRFDPKTIYSSVTLLNDGIFDAIRVTLRRDGTTNPSVSLFFARILGVDHGNMTTSATAVLQKPTTLVPGSKVLPFAIPKDVWDGRALGDSWSIYGNGKVVDGDGNQIPGNWGTVDIGHEGNSTHDLNDQITDGLHQSDLDVLYSTNRIGQNTHIDATVEMWANADTGISQGVKKSVVLAHDESRLVPIYSEVSGEPGNNLEFHISGWGVVTVVDSSWGGNVSVTIKKTHAYLGSIAPLQDLTNESGIEAAFTSPVLVE